MRLTSLRALKSAFFCLLLTSFVTACVKNNNKDGIKPAQEELALEQKALTQSTDSTGSIHTVDVDSEIAYKKITQTWSFNIKQDSDLQVLYPKITHTPSSCTNPEERPIVRFEVQEFGKKSEPLLTKGYRLTIKAGQYILRAIIDNRGLCKKLSLSFNTKFSLSSLLSYNSSIKAHYICNTVTYKRSNQYHLIAGEHAEIYTQPMKVMRINKHGHIVEDSLNMRHGKICGKNVYAAINNCSEGISDNKDENAYYTSKHQCHRGYKGEMTRASVLTLLMNEGKISSNFKCHFRGQRRNYKFENCFAVYNLGETLPLMTDHGTAVIDVMVRKRKMVINFDFNRHNLDAAKLPGQIHVNIYNTVTGKAVFTSSTQMTQAKLLNGNFELLSAADERGIRRKLRDHNPRHLELVITREANDYKSGLYHFPLRGLL